MISLEKIEYVRLELKVCEMCGRSFTREIGSTERGCKQDRGGLRARKTPEETVIITLSPEFGKFKLERVKLHLTAELAKHIREESAFDLRSSALADACELVEKVAGSKRAHA